jgi:hypothetical protein
MSPQPAGPRARFHAFLRRLRAKGRSNMYGAVPYLMRAFELGRDDAFRIVCEWIDAQEQEATAPPPPPERPRRRTPRARGITGKRRRTTS